jgi:hypothetical protein
MSTVAEIKQAIELLSPQEYCELMAMLHPLEDDDWDLKMQNDAAEGRFRVLNEKAEQDYVAGPIAPLEKIIGQEP